MYRPRRLTVRSASAKDSVPAATCAEYSPRLWPAANARLQPARRRQARNRGAHREDRRLRVLGQHQPLVRPLEAQRAERLAERRVRLGERVAADGKRVGERPAHAHFLGALSGKNECDHLGGAADCGDRGPGKVARQPPDQIFVHRAHRHRHRVGDRLRRRPAVADDAEAVEADERSAAVLGVIDAAAEAAERLARQHVADAAAEGRRRARRAAAPRRSRPALRSASASRCR